jgi:hypothetical protein
MSRLASQTAGLMLSGAFVAFSVLAAVKQAEKPDREMLRMMELLKEMEMLQQIEMMRDMHEAEKSGEPPRNAGARKTTPPKTKGTAK